MSYQLYDANGYVTDLCSGGGYADLMDWLEAGDKTAKDLAKDGELLLTDDTIAAVKAWKLPEAKDTASIVAILKKFVPKMDEILIISDGVQETQTKAFFPTEEKAESYWKEYVSRAETFEADAIGVLKEMFLKQKVEALRRLQSGNRSLLDAKEAKLQYKESMTPVLQRVLSTAERYGSELVKPENPHKGDSIPPVLSQSALRWLQTRINWAADEIGEESAARLASALSQGFEAGESIQQIALRIEAEFDYFSRVRSTRIARTEVMTASNIGAEEGYKDAGVTKSEWYTAIDERVCDLCFPLHGEIHDISEGFRPPAHVDCRCTLLPVIER